MKTKLTLFAATAVLLASGALAAQEKQEKKVLISPTERELSDDDKKSLQQTLDKKLAAIIEQCVAGYPRPEFFATFAVRFELRKSGELRGGYLSPGAVDSNLYVESDEARDKLEEEGSFTRMVVRSDRDLDRCLKKRTRALETDVNRVSGNVEATYAVKWKGKKAKLEATTFEVSK